MPPTRIFTKTEFQSVALGLAIDVHIGRVSYPYAEITLMELRAGQHYERIDKAFDEAAASLLHFLRLVDEIDSLCSRPEPSTRSPLPRTANMESLQS